MARAIPARISRRGSTQPKEEHMSKTLPLNDADFPKEVVESTLPVLG